MAMELAAEHRANPQNDIVNTLLTGTVEDEPLSDDEFCNFFLMLIVAGNETTRTVTSQGMRLLMEHPDQYQALVDDPSLIPDAIEEILRYNPAVIAFRRTAMEERSSAAQALPDLAAVVAAGISKPHAIRLALRDARLTQRQRSSVPPSNPSSVSVICLPSSELGAAAGIIAKVSPENPVRAIILRFLQIHILMRSGIIQENAT